MNKLMSLVLLVLFCIACEKKPICGTTTTQAETASGTTTATDCTLPDTPPADGNTSDGSTDGTANDSTDGSTGNTGLPNAAYTFDTNIQFLNADASDLAKFQKAIEIIKDVVATEEFRSSVINHTYNGVKTFVDNGGFTNEEIYQKILDGAETLRNVKNNTMDMEVELYYASTSTIGYTYANITKIYVNTKYFDGNTPVAVAENLFHEWLHKIGFTHASSYSTSRDYSVPYAVGRMIQKIGAQFN